MNIKKRIASGVVIGLLILLAAPGGFAAEGKVTMEQWLKIINPVSPKETPRGQTGKTTDTDAGEPARPAEALGRAVTIYWHMADDADVYLNGKPLRKYEPSFKTRPDEAPLPAFSAAATLFDEDVFTVGGRRGGSFGLMLIAVDSAGKIVFQTDSQSWKVYTPGEREDWFNPQAALASPSGPVTVQPDPWHPQKELKAKFGGNALSIWNTPDQRFAYLYGVVGGTGQKAPPLPEEKLAQDTGVPDLQDAVPFALQEPLDIHTLSTAQYQGAVSAAMETFRQTMGELSPEEEKRFSAKWGAYFDYPTPESVAYFNKLNPLLVEFLSLRAAIATAAVEFDGAWEEAVIAAGYESENGIREGLAIAEMQKNQLLNMQARLGQVVKEINAIGNPPDVQEAKNAAFTFISSKAFEYGAKKLGGATGQNTAKSKPTVKEQFAQAEFKQARQDGESLAKAFSRAQGELDRLGKTGASAAQIVNQQKAVRDLAASVNSSPHAKNFLKYKGDYHSQKAYNAHMKANHSEAEAKFHQEMQRRGWNKQELKEFRNSASAGSVGMDYDIGLVEKANWVSSGSGKMVRNNWLQQNGKAQTIEKWQTDAQKAWNKAYHDTTGRSAKQSWETVTSSANLESYRDLNLLGADKSKVQSIWAGQSADVTRYKMQHMLHDPALSKMEALQEASRGAAKDMNTKLIPLMEQAKAQGSLSSQALAESKRHWQKVQSVLDAFGKNEIDPITAQRRIRELTGKGIPEVVDDGSFLLESMIKGKK